MTDIRLAGAGLGYVFAFANCGLFVPYLLLGHRIAPGGSSTAGIDRLAAAMPVASVAALPIGIGAAGPALMNLFCWPRQSAWACRRR